MKSQLYTTSLASFIVNGDSIILILVGDNLFMLSEDKLPLIKVALASYKVINNSFIDFNNVID